MNLAPILLGFLTVGQGVLNRQIAARWGLTGAVMFNASVLLLATSAFFVLVRSYPHLFPAIFSGTPSLKTFKPWFLLPGLLGCAFITCIPWAISRFGAAQIFVLVVAGQMLASLAYDALLEGQPLSTTRVVGALLAVAGAVLVNLDALRRL